MVGLRPLHARIDGEHVPLTTRDFGSQWIALTQGFERGNRNSGKGMAGEEGFEPSIP